MISPADKTNMLPIHSVDFHILQKIHHPDK